MHHADELDKEIKLKARQVCNGKIAVEIKRTEIQRWKSKVHNAELGTKAAEEESARMAVQLTNAQVRLCAWQPVRIVYGQQKVSTRQRACAHGPASCHFAVRMVP